MYDGLEGFLGIVTSLLEKPIRPTMLITGHGLDRPGYSPPLPNIAIVSRRHAAVNLAVPSVCSSPLLWWKWYRRLTELELQYSSTGLPHTCMKVHKRALRWRIGRNRDLGSSPSGPHSVTSSLPSAGADSKEILLGKNSEEMKSRAFTSLYRSKRPVSSTWGHRYRYRIILRRLVLSVPGTNVLRFYYLLVLVLSMAKQKCSAQQMEPRPESIPDSDAAIFPKAQVRQMPPEATPERPEAPEQ
ncbi:hypothetical protein F5888DRAFT_370475 [Russula emetica]|nr:hypothetical protein F5888DRAFT_370475 [Russula emetica]